MEKGSLDPSLRDEIRSRVLGEGFMKIVQNVRRGGAAFKVSMRPVEIGGTRMFQAESSDGSGVQAKNFSAADAAKGLEEIISQRGPRELHLMDAKGDLHVRVTRKGRVLVSRSAEMDRKAVAMPHDRVKRTPLAEFDSSAYLRAVGIADAGGAVRASMRGKYDQVNEFLKAVGAVLPPAERGRRFVAVDCGCGKSYLTLALCLYLTEALGYGDVKVIGVDRRADVIEASRKTAARLDLGGRAEFFESDLESFDLSAAAGCGRVDMVVSLHACDTATDEALARAVEWKARHILSAPCCQHELNRHMASLSGRAGHPAAPFSGLLRQSILRERLCDILTDAFRALILRVLGYKVQVVEFVSSEATARNIMIRCEYGVKPGQAGTVGEYLALRDFWGAVPWLETRLGETLAGHLAGIG